MSTNFPKRSFPLVYDVGIVMNRHKLFLELAITRLIRIAGYGGKMDDKVWDGLWIQYDERHYPFNRYTSNTILMHPMKQQIRLSSKVDPSKTDPDLDIVGYCCKYFSFMMDAIARESSTTKP